jgi:hypothetical protein
LLQENAGSGFSSDVRNGTVNKKLLLDSVVVLLIAIVLVVGYKLSPLLLPKSDLTVLPDPACDLQRQSCLTLLADGAQVELSMGTRPVPMIKPFEVKVLTRGFNPNRVEVDFAGVDMNMGLNRPELLPRADAGYFAEVTLPVCITGQMDWLVTVLIERGSERLSIPYRLKSVPHE